MLSVLFNFHRTLNNTGGIKLCAPPQVGGSNVSLI
uniref:Uncharacterized protein n=1 Tax=Anguilla anguilla TaxID=7936 RepID=A0A0E9VTD7_ANGAN